jgi:hypothetical protein
LDHAFAFVLGDPFDRDRFEGVIFLEPGFCSIDLLLV